jgi:hypothetical protein
VNMLSVASWYRRKLVLESGSWFLQRFYSSCIF